jgi:hypothetical protein
VRVRSDSLQNAAVLATNPSALHWSQATSLSLQPGLVGKGADMFSGSDNARAEIRAAVDYLLKDAPGSDRGEIVWQVIAIVNQVARALPGGLNPLEDGMPGG